jgi:tetratricopeptide (TPR) repeat protein
MEMERWDEAIEHFNLALSVKPGFAVAYYNLGIAYMGKVRYERARENLQIYLKIRPYDADAWYNLGRTLDEMGQVDKASSYYSIALEIDPGYEAALEELSRIEPQSPEE